MPSPTEPSAQPVLRVRGLTKSFVGNVVLRDADLEVRPGQVLGLVGENGAGKSTLMKILAGVHQPDAGTIEIDGETVSFGHPVQGPAARAVDRLPGVQPAPRALGRREHLARSRAAAARHGRHDRDEPRHRRAAGRTRHHRPQGQPSRPLAVGRRAAGRRDRQGRQLRLADHPDGRADRRPRRSRGRAALPHHRHPDRPRRLRSSTSPTGSRRSSRSATRSPCSRTASRSRRRVRRSSTRPASCD
ncbi:ATP-binding cassette domain-containing protein [Nocardioides sp. B-3]|nr:ATP-binding cassette domain-containing protein [Nocardioides sp. B-3]UUZ60226.1 ATP-binding cassette domain-containing protein [Nocardioides sp. B-3]